ncbi:MAG: aminotransferase [Methylomarinum sp.]|nr:aminotransferase [Methylomarinum sp.]
MLNSQFSPWPSFTEEEANAVRDVLLSNRVNYWTGTECREFEKEFSNWCGSEYAVALANGSLALDVAFKALGLTAGDEVIVTSRTFLASVSSIINTGATPVFADISRDTQNITPNTVRAKITSKTKMILCVHLAGWPCEMDSMMALADEFGLYIVEDCAQAHGAKYKGKPVGSIGHIGTWSFCQDKIMTTGGEGGMVTTNDRNLWSKMWSYKDHGKSWDSVYERKYPSGFRWVHDSFGTNCRMIEMQAVIGRIQLKRMNDWTVKRISNLNKIWNTARKLSGLRVSLVPDNIEHAAYKCYVFVEPDKLKDGWNRDRVMAEINSLGVPCFSGSCSEVYLEKAFNDTGFRPKQRLSTAKELGETSLMFLVHPSLTEQEITLTCEAITTVVKKAQL